LGVVTDTCVIGAGIAGLTAALELSQNGHSVFALDKGRGVGGRMSVRRFSGAVFDHGAQFFEARTGKFIEMVRSWENKDLVKEWRQENNFNLSLFTENHRACFFSELGMNTVAKDLAKSLDIKTRSKVHTIRFVDRKWQVITENGEKVLANSLILTPPVPQSLHILRESGISLWKHDSEILQSITYNKCIALLLALRDKHRTESITGHLRIKEPIRSVFDNSRKGISERSAITIHAGPDFSAANWYRPEVEIKTSLVEAAGFGQQADIADYQVHRWRYSEPTETYPTPYYHVQAPAPLILAGDAFGRPGVEGAALSGLAAANVLLN